MRPCPAKTRPLCSVVALAALLSTCTLSSFALAQPKPHEVTPPTVLTHVDATYPESAVASQRHADVVLLVTIDVDGHVTAVDVAQSGGADLDESAVVAMRQWTFHPAMRDGKPVAARIRVPFHFAPPAPPPEPVPPGPTPVVGGVSASSNGVGVTSPPPSAVTAVGPTPSQAPPSASAPNAPNAGAASGSAPATKPEDAIEDVTVRGRTEPPSRGASDFNLRVGDLSRVPRGNASEILKLAPGIMLTNEGGEGHAEQVFLRGFDAREGQDIEFTFGGVPMNQAGNLHGNGYADTHFIIPELVTRLRVVEGPFDPRQGNFAVAGSADYELGLEKRGLTAKALGGSFGTERMLLTWGPKEESTHTFAGAEVYKTDGFGQNRDAQRATAMGQYEGRVGSKGSYRLTGTAYTTTYHSAGVIRADDYQAGRIGFYDSYDFSSFAREATPQGGDTSIYTISGDIESKAGDTLFGEQLFVTSRSMRLRENFTGFLLDVQEPLQSLHPQRGDMIDLSDQAVTIGSKGYARLSGKAFDLPQQLELGYFARGDSVQSMQQRLEAATGNPYATETNLDSKIGDLGLYGDANLRLLKWLSARGGVRADLFSYDVNNLCAVQTVAHPSTTNPPIDQSCLSQTDFGKPREPNERSSTASTAVMPRASLIAGPFRGFTLSASYGQGARSIDPAYITQDVKTPFAQVDAYETGASYAHTIGDVSVVARSIFFQTHVDRDLIFSETAGRNVLGAGTTRTGWVGATRLTGTFFDESANVTLVRSTYDDTHLLVAYVPDVVVRSDTAVFSYLPWHVMGEPIKGALAAGVSYVGKRPLPYGEVSDVVFTVDASATLSWTHYELGIQATNLLDNKYRLGEYNFASDFHSQAEPTLVPMRSFTAGAPRAVFATFAVNLGGS